MVTLRLVAVVTVTFDFTFGWIRWLICYGYFVDLLFVGCWLRLRLVTVTFGYLGLWIALHLPVVIYVDLFVGCYVWLRLFPPYTFYIYVDCSPRLPTVTFTHLLFTFTLRFTLLLLRLPVAVPTRDLHVCLRYLVVYVTLR